MFQRSHLLSPLTDHTWCAWAGQPPGAQSDSHKAEALLSCMEELLDDTTKYRKAKWRLRPNRAAKKKQAGKMKSLDVLIEIFHDFYFSERASYIY